MAQARHCSRTGQVEQISFARLLNSSDCGKKTLVSTLRQAAKLRQSSSAGIQLEIMYQSARGRSRRYALDLGTRNFSAEGGTHSCARIGRLG